MQIAQRHPAVLAEPAPSVTFDSFGDSAVNLSAPGVFWAGPINEGPHCSI